MRSSTPSFPSTLVMWFFTVPSVMLSSAPMDVLLNANEAPTELVDALQRFTWLQSPYERRADSVGDAWRQARQHAQADAPIANQAQA